jgi:hypothetical protein
MSEYSEADMREAFKKGWAACLKRGRTSYELDGVTERTANTIFDRWHNRNFQQTDETGEFVFG